jgi:hypothetical protein
MEILTDTSCFPGRLVITDTNEWCCKVCTTGATTALGVLDIEPLNRRTIQYNAGDQARILTGPIIVLLTVDTGAAVAIGDTLIPANSGMVQKGTTAGAIVAVALQAVAAGTRCEILCLLEI